MGLTPVPTRVGTGSSTQGSIVVSTEVLLPGLVPLRCRGVRWFFTTRPLPRGGGKGEGTRRPPGGEPGKPPPRPVLGAAPRTAGGDPNTDHHAPTSGAGTQGPPDSEPGQPLSVLWLGRGPENPGAPTREPVLALTEGAGTRKPTIPALSEGAPTQEPVSAMRKRAPTQEPVEIGIVMDK